MAVSHPFDPGPIAEPFASLARDYPGPEVYPPDRFRVEWGPIFHRGRLDGSARLLVLGQDPGQHESIARRILVGEAGQRTQGFMRRLGVAREYAMVNAYLYSVYGQPPKGSLDDVQPKIDKDRFRWLEALTVDTEVRAAVSFGGLARELWERWRKHHHGPERDLPFVPLPHPTMPDAASRGDPAKRKKAMKDMLERWNAGLGELDDALRMRPAGTTLELYGEDLADSDVVAIPEEDLPAGSPPWMRSLKTWASREGADPETKRATVVVTVPKPERPWH